MSPELLALLFEDIRKQISEAEEIHLSDDDLDLDWEPFYSFMKACVADELNHHRYDLHVFPNDLSYEKRVELFHVSDSSNRYAKNVYHGVVTLAAGTMVGDLRLKKDQSHGFMLLEKRNYFRLEGFAQQLFKDKTTDAPEIREKNVILKAMREYIQDISFAQEHNILFRHALQLKDIFYRNEQEDTCVSVCLDCADLSSFDDFWHKSWNVEHVGLVTVEVLGEAQFLNYYYPMDLDEPLYSIYDLPINAHSLFPSINTIHDFILRARDTRVITSNAKEFSFLLLPATQNVQLTINQTIVQHRWLAPTVI